MATSQTSAADAVSAKITGYGISYAITSILSALLVVLKESNEGVHGLLVAITGHHWILSWSQKIGQVFKVYSTG